MTGEQLIQEVFVNHWLFTTIFLPSLALVYAYITNQIAWCICSFVVLVIHVGCSAIIS